MQTSSFTLTYTGGNSRFKTVISERQIYDSLTKEGKKGRKYRYEKDKGKEERG